MGVTRILLKGVHSENSYTQVCLNHLILISLATQGYPGRHISLSFNYWYSLQEFFFFFQNILGGGHMLALVAPMLDFIM